MSQIWKHDRVIPITVIQAAPNKVSLVRTKDKEGYEAVQLDDGKNKKEFRVEESGHKAGDSVDVSIFKEGDLVKISGTSKGKGFQGVVKRHGFHGGPKTHGQKNRHRAPGSVGAGGVQRVIPGLRMAGRMGSDRITIKNLRVAAVDPEKNLILIQGAVPGNRGALLEIRKIGEKPFKEIKEEKETKGKKGAGKGKSKK